MVNKHLFKITFINTITSRGAVIGALVINFHLFRFIFWYYKITIIKYKIIRNLNFAKALHFSCVWSKKSQKIKFCSICESKERCFYNHWCCRSVQYNTRKRRMVHLMRAEYIYIYIFHIQIRFCTLLLLIVFACQLQLSVLLSNVH